MIARRALAIAALVVALAGVALLAYPAVSTELHTRAMVAAVEEHQERVAAQPASALERLYARMAEYNEELVSTGQSGLVDPFAYEQPSLDLSPFGLEDHIVGSLEIPALGLTAPIYLGASLENLDKGVAHLSQTSLPIGGASTNTVLAGHRAPGMFWDLDRLTEGDTVLVTTFHGTLTYRVISAEVIRPDEIDRVLIRPGQDLVTLLTCHPKRHNYQRLMVVAARE